MPDKDIFAEREHWLEEEYFRKKNQELIEKIRLRQQKEAEREHMGEALGVTDQDLLSALQDLGYTEETIKLLHLIPLVQVAWSEGGVADSERELILKVARSRGVEPGGAADLQLSKWLDEKPPEQFFENTLHAIGLIFATLPPEQRAASSQDLISYCAQIAAAVSGGFFGRGKITDEERATIAHIAAEIGQGRDETVRKIINRS